MKLGKSRLEIDGIDIMFDGKRYKGTRGLYELIFKSHPDKYDENDLSQYYDILQQTNVHRRNFNGTQQMRGSTAYKWVEVIRPVLMKTQTQKKSWTGASVSLIANANTSY